MYSWIEKNRKPLLLISVASILIPLLYVTYMVISSQKNAVTVTIDWHPVLVYVLIAYYVLLVGTLLGYAIYEFIKHIKLIFKLKNEKTKTELLHLKTQVNPHFFFNMLNNLYSLIDIDPEKAKKLILKLSDMMRYSIYEGQKEQVTIKEEIDFITNFIALHKMRYHKNNDIVFTTEISDANLKVMPLLFIILVENAFKHGVEVLRSDAFVHITLHADSSKIHFEVENNFDVEHKNELGIGLQNLKRRLALVYPKQYHFSTTKDDAIFKAALTLYTND